MSVYLEPILDPNTNEYMDVLTVSEIPEGPLGQRVRHMRTNDLSEFKPRISQTNCKYILMDEDQRTYMTIPQMFSFMRKNGYTIDMGLTKLYKASTPNCVCVFFSAE